MRAISIIYRREIGAYLRQPIGWIIAAVILLADGIFFQAWAMQGQLLSAQVLERFFFLSSFLFGTAGILLSFRLIAEERANHSLVLLNTSPVRDSEIVIGKFLAALTFITVMLVLSLYMPFAIKSAGKVTAAQIFVGYLGLFLFSALGLAIGIFASSLTKSLLIALLVAAFIMVVLGNVYQLAMRLDSPVKEVAEQIDTWWQRFQNGFERGLLNLKDVVAYVAMIYFFLLLAVKTLEAKRWQ